MPSEPNRRSMFIAGCLLEGALLFAALLWIALRQLPLTPFILSDMLEEGVACTIPLLLGNWLLFKIVVPRVHLLSSFADFQAEVVVPLAKLFTPPTAFVIAVLAGLAEEFFFRATLQQECGLILASIIFSLAHFGPALVRYPLVALVYALIGFYFGLLFQSGISIWSLAFAHGLYDFLALVYLGRSQTARPELEITG